MKVSYEELVEFFGSPMEVAKYYNCKVQAVYQWKDHVPETRAREFVLVKKNFLRGPAVCQQTS
jgi:hypothetical protein